MTYYFVSLSLDGLLQSQRYLKQEDDQIQGSVDFMSVPSGCQITVHAF